MRAFAAIFPGQGSQHAGMGRDLSDAFPESRAVFASADEVLGEPLSASCFSGPDAVLARTEVTQPSILTVSAAALAALVARGARPSWAAGHSLGEYGAHVAAGTFAFEDAVAVVRQRGRFMQEAVPVGVGAMAAILGLDAERVAALCAEVAGDEVVSPANMNGAGQVVVAGHASAVARLAEAALAAGAKRAVPLPVSAPFHCALMEPAAARLAEVLERVEFAAPRIDVYTNVDAAPVRTAAGARSALVRQVASPVRWEEEVTAMADAGVDTFVEIGPGKVLSGLVKRIARQARLLAVGDRESLESTLRALEAEG